MLSPVHEDGRLVQYVVVQLDVTERHRAEEDLRRAMTELEARNDEVEAFAKVQRDFVASASHELRTPLTAVLDELQRDYLGVVDESARQLLTLVDDLLTVNKVTGHLSVDSAPVGLARLVASGARRSRPSASARASRSGSTGRP